MKKRNHENKQISIIIPCYNSAEFLESCLDSILNQSYKYFEILAINDGSTDSTSDILSSYAEKDSRIKVFSQENKGVSTTRNRGIKLSSGTYIMFVDADDYIGEHYLNDMLSYIEKNKADLVISGATFCNEDGKINRQVSFSRQAQELIFTEIITDIVNRVYFSSCWKTLINKEFLKKNEIYFEPRLDFGEDCKFMISMLEKASKACFFPSNEYYYRTHSNNVSNSSSLSSTHKYMDDNIHVFGYLSQYTAESYLVPNRLLSKLNIAIKKLAFQTEKLKDFEIIFESFNRKYGNVMHNDLIRLSKIDYVNILDRILLYCLNKKKSTLYFLVSKLYYFLIGIL